MRSEIAASNSKLWATLVAEMCVDAVDAAKASLIEVVVTESRGGERIGEGALDGDGTGIVASRVGWYSATYFQMRLDSI